MLGFNLLVDAVGVFGCLSFGDSGLMMLGFSMMEGGAFSAPFWVESEISIVLVDSCVNLGKESIESVILGAVSVDGESAAGSVGGNSTCVDV